MHKGMQLRIASDDEVLRFLAGHERRVSAGAVVLCSCGWAGADWWGHRQAMLDAWIEAQRRVLRARRLAQEGVDRP